MKAAESDQAAEADSFEMKAVAAETEVVAAVFALAATFVEDED